METIYTKDADTSYPPAGVLSSIKNIWTKQWWFTYSIKPLLQASVIPNFDAMQWDWMSTKHACNHGTYTH